MRKEIYRMDRAGAAELFARAEVVHVASTTAEGEPLLRTVHGVVVDGYLAFHGAPAGEKTESKGRAAVIAASETVASIPSYFVDKERACPATTYYLSAQVHGVLEEATDPEAKARVLRALMDKFQPEKGYVPIDVTHPLYRKAVPGLMVLRVPLERIDGKAKVGQNRTPEERARVLEQLWARGRRGDDRAIELVRACNPDTPTPAFLACPEGARLSCALGPEDLPAASALVAGEYWNDGVARAELEEAMRGASAWVGAHDAEGRLIATARALSDGAKVAWIYDVCVAEEWRSRGLGLAVARLLLDHPAVRGARVVRLATRDAQGLYAKLGFAEASAAWTEMVLRRASA